MLALYHRCKIPSLVLPHTLIQCLAGVIHNGTGTFKLFQINRILQAIPIVSYTIVELAQQPPGQVSKGRRR